MTIGCVPPHRILEYDANRERMLCGVDAVPTQPAVSHAVFRIYVFVSMSSVHEQFKEKHLCSNIHPTYNMYASWYSEWTKWTILLRITSNDSPSLRHCHRRDVTKLTTSGVWRHSLLREYFVAFIMPGKTYSFIHPQPTLYRSQYTLSTIHVLPYYSAMVYDDNVSVTNSESTAYKV